MGSEDITQSLYAPMQAIVLSVEAEIGQLVASGHVLMTLEAMKMQHPVRAPFAGRVTSLAVNVEEIVEQDALLLTLEKTDETGEQEAAPAEMDTQTITADGLRADLREVQVRKSLLLDEARPEAVARRHGLGKQMARENIAQLCDAGSFVEYGDLAVAAQRRRRSMEDLIKNTPADGLVAGLGCINGETFTPDRARAGVMAYDYTVLAGTQGVMNHGKTDRLLDIVERQRLPLVFFCEGGGGRPGDIDALDTSIAGLYVPTFSHLARLSGLVPLIGIASGRLFAGNAALLGCCDVVIATHDATIGMAGPAMIEGGGLGVYKPEEVGPARVQSQNGVIDILVEDEAEAVTMAKKYLSYFQGDMEAGEAPDAYSLRDVIPENRLQVYDSHRVIEGLADKGSILELRAEFAKGVITALMRIEGRPVGVVANNPEILSGAIDSAVADKMARFMRLCNAFDIPIVSLVDTPGMMVGPEVEKTALVRHCSRLFLAGANLEVPMMSIILRKSYGLGAQAMMGGSTRAHLFCIGWPTAEIGAMGLEGAVRLGYRKELEAVADENERKALFDKMVAEAYERGKGLNAASVLEIDTVIDPADSRTWILSILETMPLSDKKAIPKRHYVDSW